MNINKSLNERYIWVDYARGVAILLIVFRHTLVGLKRGGIHVPEIVYNFQEYAYNFRMPVFFMLSGVFLFFSFRKKSSADIFKIKISSLLYPYFFWTIILVSFQILLSGLTNSERTIFDYWYIISQPRELDHMWYLLALFNTSAICILLYKYFFARPLIHICIALLFHLISYFVRDYSLISDPLYHYIFLVFGIYTAKYLPVFEERKNFTYGKNAFLVFPFFLAGQYFWILNKPGNFFDMIPFLIIILIAALFFYFFCRFFSAVKILSQLSIVGEYSLYIYILHIYIISGFRIFSIKILGINNLTFLISGSLILGILLPIVFFRVTEKLNMWYLFAFNRPQTIHQKR